MKADCWAAPPEFLIQCAWVAWGPGDSVSNHSIGEAAVAAAASGPGF